MATILHLDMDAFFASVEQHDDPSLAGKPVIIGCDPRGVVSAASYEARVYGVRSAMPVVEARRRCPHGVFLRGNRHRYSEVSRQVMACLEGFSPLVEPASIDEAYVDITGTETLFGPPEALGRRIKALIRETTGLSCSVGIAPVKFLAKIASDYDKPDGLTLVAPDQVMAFLADLPVGRIPGVGKRAEAKLGRLGIRVGRDMLAYPPEFFRASLRQVGAGPLTSGPMAGEARPWPQSARPSRSAPRTPLPRTRPTARCSNRGCWPRPNGWGGSCARRGLWAAP
jgi:DNA polymerase-4